MIEILQHPAVVVMLFGVLYIICGLILFMIGVLGMYGLLMLVERIERTRAQRSQWFDRLKRWTRGERNA